MQTRPIRSIQPLQSELGRERCVGGGFSAAPAKILSIIDDLLLA